MNAKRRRNTNNQAQHQYSNLEDRRMLAGISLESIAGRATLLIDGSSANDVAQVQDLNNGQVKATLNGQSQTFAKSQFERIRFLGRSGNDTFANHTDIDSAIMGHAGNDNLQGGSGHNWMQGGSGNDTLTGGTRNDQIRGGEGDDVIRGGDRHDRLFGGNGQDTILGGQGNDFISGENGNDKVWGEAGRDRVFGGAGLDSLFGGAGDDLIDGGSEADEIGGGNGNDRLFGMAGNDVIYGGAGADLITGDAGNDRATGGAGNDTINLGTSSGDVAVYGSKFSNYKLVYGNPVTVDAVNATDGQDRVSNTETLRFSDGDRPTSQADLNAAETASRDLLHDLRRSKGLSSYTVAADLSSFARNWSQEMSNSGFRHSDIASRSYLITGDRTRVSENIVFAGDTSLSATQAAERFHQIWVNSSTHYANMVSTRWTEVGIGIVLTNNGWFGTMTFSDG